MIGVRAGIVCGVKCGVAAGISADPIGGSSVDALILIWGQSHAQGFSDDSASGSGDTSGGDGKGLGYRLPGSSVANPFEACRYNQTSSNGPTSPMVWNVNTGTEGLQPYAAPGANNTGVANALGRFLVRHGMYRNPAIIVCAINSSSVPANWLPSSNYPASGEKVYAHLRDFCLARQAEFGRPIDMIIHQIGESDAGTQARIDSCVADYTAMYGQLRSDLGIPTAHVFVTLIHPDTSGNNALNNQMRTQQALWATGDGHASSATTDGFWLPLDANPHYKMGGFNDLGDLFGLAVRDRFFAGRNLDLQTIASGAYPFFQGNAAAFSSQASPNTARPRGYIEPKVGDVEVLIAHGNGTAHTVSLTVAAGFTSLIATVDSVSGASHRTITVWTRVIDQTMLDARPAFTDGVRRGPCATPSVDFGVATLNMACIYCVRGADPANPVAATASGVNNAGTTSVTVGTLTTAHDNSLIMFGTCTNGLAGQITAISNANLTDIGVPAAFPVGRDHQINPGAGTINMAMTTAKKATAGAIGSTTITFGASSLNAAVAIAFNPKP
jgi:hypothetical protein